MAVKNFMNRVKTNQATQELQVQITVGINKTGQLMVNAPSTIPGKHSVIDLLKAVNLLGAAIAMLADQAHKIAQGEASPILQLPPGAKLQG